MEVIICESPTEVSSLVAKHVCDLVRSKPAAVLGLATGRTPQLTYHQIVRLAEQGRVQFSDVRAFMLDEYLGITDDHPSRFRNTLNDFFGDVGISEDNIFALPNDWPPGDQPDVELTHLCQEYEEQIVRIGGIDLQLLGVSDRGHIAFNEPMSSMTSRTRVKTLTDQTRDANADSFAKGVVVGTDAETINVHRTDDSDDVPRHVVTQGIGTILDSHHAILIATGSGKSEIVAQLIEGPIAAFVPASALQMHQHVTVVLDEDAASELKLAKYYRQVQSYKRYIQPPIT